MIPGIKHTTNDESLEAEFFHQGTSLSLLLPLASLQYNTAIEPWIW